MCDRDSPIRLAINLHYHIAKLAKLSLFVPFCIPIFSLLVDMCDTSLMFRLWSSHGAL